MGAAAEQATGGAGGGLPTTTQTATHRHAAAVAVQLGCHQNAVLGLQRPRVVQQPSNGAWHIGHPARRLPGGPHPAWFCMYPRAPRWTGGLRGGGVVAHDDSWFVFRAATPCCAAPLLISRFKTSKHFKTETHRLLGTSQCLPCCPWAASSDGQCFGCSQERRWAWSCSVQPGGTQMSASSSIGGGCLCATAAPKGGCRRVGGGGARWLSAPTDRP